MLKRTLFCAGAVLPIRIPSGFDPLREMSSKLLLDPSKSIAAPEFVLVLQVRPWMPRVLLETLILTQIPTPDIVRFE